VTNRPTKLSEAQRIGPSGAGLNEPKKPHRVKVGGDHVVMLRGGYTTCNRGVASALISAQRRRTWLV
jgi:hypothetical protein